jgi:hypothetical protein
MMIQGIVNVCKNLSQANTNEKLTEMCAFIVDEADFRRVDISRVRRDIP